MMIDESYLRTAIRQADLRPLEREALGELITYAVRLSREQEKANTPRPLADWSESIPQAFAKFLGTIPQGYEMSVATKRHDVFTGVVTVSAEFSPSKSKSSGVE